MTPAAGPARQNHGRPGHRDWQGYDCGQLSWVFLRVIDVPFDLAVTALDGWLRDAPRGILKTGRHWLVGPLHAVPGTGQAWIEVRAQHRAPWPAGVMELQVTPWSLDCRTTGLELMPRRHLRPTPRYFSAGHLLLDTLSAALAARAGHDVSRRTPADEAGLA